MKALKSLFQIIFLLTLFCTFSGFERAEVKKEKIGNIEIAYYTRGSGDPLVMIPGFRSTMAIWDPALLDILEKKYKLILLDNRGAGLSSDSSENLTTMSQMAEDTVNLIKSLGLSKAHILGWSMGSKIAMQIGVQFPEIVDTLILCAPNAGGKTQIFPKTDAHALLTSPNLSQEKGLSLIFPNTPEGKKASEDLVGRLEKAMLLGSVPNDMKINEEAKKRQINALKLWDEDNSFYNKLSGIRLPTLITSGLDDVINEPENARLIANQIPFAWSVYFNGSGHNFLSQDYQHFSELIDLFIESNKKNVAK